VQNVLCLVSRRNQMISTLRDELTQRCHEIIELEAALSSLNQQVKFSKLNRNTAISTEDKGTC